jgi:hypothetical protein
MRHLLVPLLLLVPLPLLLLLLLLLSSGHRGPSSTHHGDLQEPTWRRRPPRAGEHAASGAQPAQRGVLGRGLAADCVEAVPPPAARQVEREQRRRPQRAQRERRGGVDRREADPDGERGVEGEGLKVQAGGRAGRERQGRGVAK